MAKYLVLMYNLPPPRLHNTVPVTSAHVQVFTKFFDFGSCNFPNRTSLPLTCNNYYAVEASQQLANRHKEAGTTHSCLKGKFLQLLWNIQLQMGTPNFKLKENLSD